jgi:hypothetical protein
VRGPALVSVYYMNEGAFELPDAPATDRTTHVIQTTVGGHELTLAVVRTRLPEGKSLRQVAQHRVLDEMELLSGYSVLEEREASWAGVPVLEIASRWRHEGKVVYQQQAHLVLRGTWIYFALSTPSDGRAAADAWFSRIRESIRLRSED